MYRQTKAVVYNRSILDAWLAALGTRPSAALAPTITVLLFTDSTVNPVPTAALSTFAASEATFTGYARPTATFTGPVNLTTVIQALIASVLFTVTAGTPTLGDTIWGYVVVNGTDWLAAEKFAQGDQVTIGAPGDFLALDMALPMQPYLSAA